MLIVDGKKGWTNLMQTIRTSLVELLAPHVAHDLRYMSSLVPETGDY